MAIIKKGIIGPPIGKIGTVTGYVKYDKTILQSSRIRGNQKNTLGIESLKNNYRVYIDGFKDEAEVIDRFGGFSQSPVIDTVNTPMASIVAKYRSATKGVYKVPVMSNVIGTVPLVVKVELTEDDQDAWVRFRYDEGLYPTDERLRIGILWSSLNGIVAHADWRNVSGGFYDFFEELSYWGNPVRYYCECFVYSRDSDFCSQVHAFVVVNSD